MNINTLRNGLAILLASWAHLTPAVAETGALSLQEAVDLALNNDPGTQVRQAAKARYEATAEAALLYPDPVISLGVANLPTDTFDFDQEPMTQLQVGVSQMFPRGDSLSLKQRQQSLLAGREKELLADRQALIQQEVGSLWLDLYQAEESITLIEASQQLLAQWQAWTEATYASGFSGQQEDILSTELAILRLNEKRLDLQQTRIDVAYRLRQWLGDGLPDWPGQSDDRWSQGSPPLLSSASQAALNQARAAGRMSAQLTQHPAIQALETQRESKAVEVSLAEQEAKPLWGLNAGYGYRDEDRSGRNLADFVSLGVRVEVPLFSRVRSQHSVRAAQAESREIQAQQDLLRQRMSAQLLTALNRYEQYARQAAFYENDLLIKLAEQTETLTAAYSNREGALGQVMQAQLAELDARLALLKLQVAQSRQRVVLQYLTTQMPMNTQGDKP